MRDHVQGDLSALMASPDSPIEASRLKIALENDPLPQVPDVLPGLRDLVRPFETPFRDAWLEEEAKGEGSRVRGLRPEDLFG